MGIKVYSINKILDENDAPLSRSRGKKSLNLWGFQCLKMTRQGFYTLFPKNGVLHRNRY